MRSEAEQTDEGWGAVTVLMKLQSYLPVLPCPHPPLWGTFPQGKAFGAYKYRNPMQKGAA